VALRDVVDVPDVTEGRLKGGTMAEKKNHSGGASRVSKQTEKALRESEHQYRLLFDNMTTGFALHEMLYDEQGNPVDYRFLDANQAFGRLTGLSVASRIGRTVLEVLPGTERRWIEAYAKVVQTGTPVLFEEYSGALAKWFEVRAFRTVGNQFGVILADITGRKHLETEIHDAREYAKNIVETMREPLLVLDSDLRILTANHNFYDTFKGTPETTIGKFIYDLGNRQWDIPELRVLLEKILPDETVFNGYEVEHEFPDIGRKTIVLNARQIYRKEVGSHLILLAMEDITGRKHLETEIHDAREYAENIVETMREPLLVLDSDLRILTANHNFYDTFKGTPETTIGKFIYDLGNRQWDIPELRVLLEKILPDETVFNGYEVEHEFPDIGRKTMVLNARQIYRKEVGSHLILLAMEDITERKWLEQEVAHLASYPVQNPNVVVEVATDGTVRFANPAALAALARLGLGTDTRQLLPGTPEELVLLRSRCEQNPQTQELHLGGATFLRVVAASLGGDTLRVYAMDITERKRAQEALAESENEYRLLVESSHDIIYTLDLSGVFTFVSPSWKQMLGHENDAVVGHRFHEFVHPDDIARCEELLAFALQTREPIPSIEYRIRNVQGEWRWHNSDGTRVINADGTCSSVVAVASDVTDRKQAEEELRESKELLSETEKTARIGGWVFDVEELTQEWTEETFRILEIDVAKGEPKVPEGVDFIAPAFRPMAEQGIRRAIEFGEPYDQEWEIITAKGNRRWVHAVAQAHQEQGKTKRVSGSIQDITERKEMEEGLRESHERFQLANRATFDTIWDWNLLTDALWWNENLQKVFNYPAEEIEPSIESRTKRIHPEDVDRVSTSIHTAIDSGQQSWFDHYRFRRKDGSFAEIEDRGYIGRELNGKPVRMIGAMQDVSQRKRGEDALRESEERYRTLIQNVGEGIGFVDPEEQFAFTNAAAEDLFGVPPGGLLGRSLREFTSPEQFAMIREQTDRRQAGEKGVYEIEISRPGGEERNVLVSAVPQFDSQGRFVGALGVFRDITDRVRTEANKEAMQSQLRQSQKMEAIGTLAGGVAHDFNNLLTGILGNIALMRGSLPPADPFLENLNAAETAARQAADLTKGLLTFSRSAMVLPVPMNITAALDAALALLKQSLPATMDVVRDYDQTAWNVLMDQSQMTQILLNLAVNARDAMKGQGTLTIRARNEVVGEEYLQTHPFARTGEFVHLSVTDTGPGMSSEVLQHLFEPFYTTKPIGSGTGLGLSVVYGAVKQAGGWITAVSTEGVGATFDIYLPRCLEEPMESFAPSPLSVVVRGGTVLVVEDEPVVRTVTQALLSRSGYTVLTAADGASALNVLRDHPVGIGLILLDMTMPGMTTSEIVRAIRALDPAVPILLNSGYTSNGAVKQMLEQRSVQGFLGKPYSLGELTDKVQELFHRG
jgi:PAS domain S-box-containing protein